MTNTSSSTAASERPTAADAVTQADREAAAEYMDTVGWPAMCAVDTRAGYADRPSADYKAEGTLVQAFARHRLAQQTAPAAVGGECTASPDHSDIMETIQSAADDWQARGYTSALAEVRDMAKVGRSLMERLPEGYSYNDTPAEIVIDLLNECDDLRAALSPAASAPATAMPPPAGGDVLREAYTPTAIISDDTPVEIAPGIIATLGDLKYRSRDDILAAPAVASAEEGEA